MARFEARLPERTRRAIAEQQSQAEILIAWIQLAIVAGFALVYVAAPQATMLASPHFEPLLWVLGAYAAVTALRLFLAYRHALGRWLLSASVVDEHALLILLNRRIHQQNEQPAAY